MITFIIFNETTKRSKTLKVILRTVPDTSSENSLISFPVGLDVGVPVEYEDGEDEGADVGE